MKISLKKLSTQEVIDRGWKGYFYINPVLAITATFLLVVFVQGQTIRTYAALAEKINCSSFENREEAQRYFERTHDKRMDRDKDGLACEALPLENN